MARATGDDLIRALTDAPAHRAKPVITVRLEQDLPVKLLPAADGGRPDPRTCADLLACYGIPQLPWAWAETEDEAVIAAERLRGPDGRVVLKAHWPGLLHESEQCAVRTGPFGVVITWLGKGVDGVMLGFVACGGPDTARGGETHDAVSMWVLPLPVTVGRLT